MNLKELGQFFFKSESDLRNGKLGISNKLKCPENEYVICNPYKGKRNSVRERGLWVWVELVGCVNVKWQNIATTCCSDENYVRVIDKM